MAGLGSVDGPLDGIRVGAVGLDEGGSDGAAAWIFGLETLQACRLAFGAEKSPACRLTVFAASFSAFRCDTDAAIASILCCISAASSLHQVYNEVACVKIAEDFVSPEHIGCILEVTDQFRTCVPFPRHPPHCSASPLHMHIPTRARCATRSDSSSSVQASKRPRAGRVGFAGFPSSILAEMISCRPAAPLPLPRPCPSFPPPRLALPPRALAHKHAPIAPVRPASGGAACARHQAVPLLCTQAKKMLYYSLEKALRYD